MDGPIEWRPIANFEGLYEVSNTGIIRSITRDVIGKNGGKYHYESQELKPYVDTNGYNKITLSKNNKTYTYLIHRIVAETFIDNPLNLLEVDHINKVRNDNCISNLRWVTREENIENRDIKKPNSKWKPVICVETNIEYPSATEAGRRLNINSDKIGMVCRGQRKTAGHYHWKFKENQEE